MMQFEQKYSVFSPFDISSNHLYTILKETYQPYTLVGPTVKGLVQKPLAVLFLDIRLYIDRVR